MPEARRFDSIEAIGRETWNGCFPGELEDYDYLRAVERAKIPGFALAYYAVMDGNRTLAATPVFFTDYDLATTAEGALRRILTRISRAFPRLLKLKLACLGSVATEHCPVGMHPECTDARKGELFAQLLACFEHDAKAHGCGLLGIKDMSARDKAHYAPFLARYCGIGGMPGASLAIDFASVDTYLARLSAGTRKDMRRKLRRMEELRVEYRESIDGLVEDIHAMYLETKARSDLQFEELPADFFREVPACMPGRAIYSLYFAGETMIAANLLLLGNGRLLDKFFCMREHEGKDYSLYFLSWFANIRYCLEHGIGMYESGQAGYDTKLRLGCALNENTMYFRHNNPIINRLLRTLAPLLAFDIPTRNQPA